MSGSHSSTGHSSASLNTTSPLKTTLFGLAASALFGLLISALSTVIFFWYLLDAPSFVIIIAFGSIWFGIGEETYRLGRNHTVPIGSVGVPTLLDGRARTILGLKLLLAEGSHWLPPIIMKLVTVSVQTQESDSSDNDDFVSRDGLKMRGSFFFRYQVSDPYAWFSFEDPEASLLNIAEPAARAAFAQEDANDLCHDENKREGIAARITSALKPRARVAGVTIVETLLTRAEPPQEVLDANAKKLVEVAQKESEKTELDGVIDRIRDLKAEGFSPKEAYEIIGGERGKVKTTRQIYKVEGLEGLGSLADLIKNIFSKGDK